MLDHKHPGGVEGEEEDIFDGCAPRSSQTLLPLEHCLIRVLIPIIPRYLRIAASIQHRIDPYCLLHVGGRSRIDTSVECSVNMTIIQQSPLTSPMFIPYLMPPR